MKRLSLPLYGIFLFALFMPTSVQASWWTSLRNKLLKRRNKPKVTLPAPTAPAPKLQTSQASVKAFNRGIQSLWDTMRPTLVPTLKKGLANLKGKKNGSLTIDDVQITGLDIKTSPALNVTPYTAPGISGQKLSLFLPAAPGWNLWFNVKLRYDLVKKILFFTLRKTFRLTLKIKVANLMAQQSLVLDTTNPQFPTVKKIEPTQVNFKLSVGSTNPVANVVLRLASPILTWFLKKKLKKIIAKFMPTLQKTILNKPAPPIGLGGPTMAGTTARPKLLNHALDVDKNILKYHMPNNTIISVVTSQPKGGTVTTHYSGDSAIWTGHYLAGEAFRYRMTKSAESLKIIQRLLKGIEVLMDVCKPGGGLLARYAAPVNSVAGKYMRANKKVFRDIFERTLGNTRYIAFSYISRDQYCGVMLGLATAYDYVSDPGVKKKCASLISRVVNYLDSQKWIARRVTPPPAGSPNITAPFLQTPGQLYNFIQIANHVNPTQFGTLHKKYAPLTPILWIPSTLGALETHFKYYGFNLGHATHYSMMRLEKDTQRYQDELRDFLITRKAVSHHRNAWFNLVTIAVIPGQKSQYKDQIIDDIRRFALRDQWESAIPKPTKNDPSIAKIDYSGLQFNKVGWNLSGAQSLKATGNKERIAKFPQPVERRAHTDFLWQRSPFQLSTNRQNLRFRNPGVDMVLPYWMARVYGILK